MITEPLEPRRLLALFGFDVSFGDGGTAAVSADTVLEVLPDGKLLTIGNRLLDLTGHDAQPVLLVSRLNTDGTIDTSFGEGGRLNFGDAVHAAYVAPRFYVVDFTSVGPDALEAYTTDGVLDPAFSGDGR